MAGEVEAEVVVVVMVALLVNNRPDESNENPALVKDSAGNLGQTLSVVMMVKQKPRRNDKRLLKNAGLKIPFD